MVGMGCGVECVIGTVTENTDVATGVGGEGATVLDKFWLRLEKVVMEEMLEAGRREELEEEVIAREVWLVVRGGGDSVSMETKASLVVGGATVEREKILVRIVASCTKKDEV